MTGSRVRLLIQDIKYSRTVRLRVVSNFGDGDCGAGEIGTHVRAKFRGDATRGEHHKLIFWRFPRVASPRNFARLYVYFAHPTITIAKIRDYSQSTAL